MAELPPEINIDYLKSHSYRVVHADGIWGGLTPRADVFLTIYSERPPIPTRMTYKVTEDGALGPEIEERRQCRDAAVVREVEVGIVMSIELARATVKWLQDKIDTAEKIISEHTKDRNND